MWARGGGNNDGSWPKICSDCAHSALTVFKGIQPGTFNKCLRGRVPISIQCSHCFAKAAQYAYTHCKVACFGNQWGDRCLKCTAGFDIKGCIGFDVPQPIPV